MRYSIDRDGRVRPSLHEFWLGGSLPDSHAVPGRQIERFTGLHRKGVVPGIDVAHGVGSILSGRVRVSEHLLAESGFAGF